MELKPVPSVVTMRKLPMHCVLIVWAYSHQQSQVIILKDFAVGMAHQKYRVLVWIVIPSSGEYTPGACETVPGWKSFAGNLLAKIS
ncbi:hypothetical protein C0J52_06440 [Blattella germanica]|nr:hypothetical protein C0J52_06440 [Blattella germanica]